MGLPDPEPRATGNAGSPADGAPRVRRLGRTGYRETWQAMQAFTDRRDGTTPDELWLTEHPPVYTLGLAGRDEHLHPTVAAAGIEVVRTDRGGQVTYHGPGQAIMYVLLDLRRRRLGRGGSDCVGRSSSAARSGRAAWGSGASGRLGLTTTAALIDWTI